MKRNGDAHENLPAEYAAAVAEERAEWKVANDSTLGAVERVTAYARWLSARERTKALSLSMRKGDDDGSSVQPYAT